jgi:EAL domain-containing protein (putative c-di-GMP-specific phosphodiesterase class I)
VKPPGPAAPNQPTGRAYVEAAIRARTFRLVYQPIVDLDTGAVVGVEGLCRFADGRPPGVWFDQCQRLGLAVPMDLAVLELAMGDLHRLPPGYVSLNLSITTLTAPDAVLRVLRPALSRRQVLLELSERVVVRDYDTTDRCLEPLRDAGVLIAIDDAGSGYSSVQHIVRLRPDVFKLDRALVHSVDVDPGRRAFAVAAAVLGRELGCGVVAEGVETAEEVTALRACGIRVAQGFHLGRPHPLPLPPSDYDPAAPVDRLQLEAPAHVRELTRSVAAIRDAVAHLRRGDTAADGLARRGFCDRIEVEAQSLLRMASDMEGPNSSARGGRSTTRQ